MGRSLPATDGVDVNCKSVKDSRRADAPGGSRSSFQVLLASRPHALTTRQEMSQLWSQHKADAVLLVPVRRFLGLLGIHAPSSGDVRPRSPATRCVSLTNQAGCSRSTPCSVLSLSAVSHIRILRGTAVNNGRETVRFTPLRPALVRQPASWPRPQPPSVHPEPTVAQSTPAEQELRLPHAVAVELEPRECHWPALLPEVKEFKASVNLALHLGVFVSLPRSSAALVRPLLPSGRSLGS